MATSSLHDAPAEGRVMVTIRTYSTSGHLGVQMEAAPVFRGNLWVGSEASQALWQGQEVAPTNGTGAYEADGTGEELVRDIESVTAAFDEAGTSTLHLSLGPASRVHIGPDEVITEPAEDQPSDMEVTMTGQFSVACSVLGDQGQVLLDQNWETPACIEAIELYGLQPLLEANGL